MIKKSKYNWRKRRKKARLSKKKSKNDKSQTKQNLPTFPKIPFSQIPNCATFKPTEDEFVDPLQYLRKIYPLAVHSGICKIIPPPSWSKTDPNRFLSRKQKFETKKQYIHKLQEGYGHDDGRNYTPLAFKKMADRFLNKKARLLNDGGKEFFDCDEMEQIERMEKMYWEMVENKTPCEVEYGSDVATSEFESGFAEGEKSNWNLIHLPNADGSLLKHLEEKISGVNEPWIYFGMALSTFCWHYEDDSLFSISYNHTGAPKIWYGAPGAFSEQVEEVFRSLLPGLFEEEPDLMMKLVTMISPSSLIAHSIPVVKAVHHPGEFIVTLPNAFHAGFNSGFNVAEAVNFALESWLPAGLRCADKYALFSRESVISHEKMVVKTAEQDNFDSEQAEHVLAALTTLLNREKKLRLKTKEIAFPADEKGEGRGEGVRAALRKRLRKPDSDVAQCRCCERKCYVSFVECSEHVGRFGCLQHAKIFCPCKGNESKKLRCSYSIAELENLVTKVKSKFQSD